MTTNVQTFSHPLFGDIRVAGTFMEPLFCLVDVCNALDIKNPSRAKTALKPGGVHLMKVTTTQKNQHGESDKKHEVYFIFISELNFYKLIMRSDKPQAEPFQDWVCGDVLPAIRKDGGYQLNTKIGQLEARIASQKVLLNETCAVVAKQEQDIDHLFDDASYAIDVPPFHLVLYHHADSQGDGAHGAGTEPMALRAACAVLPERTIHALCRVCPSRICQDPHPSWRGFSENHCFALASGVDGEGPQVYP